MLDGHVDPDFAGVADTLGAILVEGGGGAVAVSHRGRMVADVWGGTRDDRGSPWSADTRVMSFSTTKGLVALVLHRLAERGLVDYDAPVATYWPEFGGGGKEVITLRHVLSHRTGLHEVRPLVRQGRDLLDWDLLVRRLERATPVWTPGRRPAYQAITFGYLAGEIIRRVTGHDTVTAALVAEVAEPLGVDEVTIGVPGGDLSTVAELGGRAYTDKISGFLERVGTRGPLRHARNALVVPGFVDLCYSPGIYAGEIPAANGVATARALAEIYAGAIGSDPERRLLSAATLDAATEIQTRDRDATIGFRMRWRLGFHLAATSKGVVPTGFGHFGFGGSGAWADPELDLVVAFVTNELGGTQFADTRILRLSTEAVRAAQRLQGGE